MKISKEHKPIKYLHDVVASIALSERFGENEFTPEQALEVLHKEGIRRSTARVIVHRLRFAGFLRTTGPTTYKCTECGSECDVIEVDQGGKEEVWGRMEHVPFLVDVSSCCKAEFEIFPGDDV